MNKTRRAALINKLNIINEKIINTKNFLLEENDDQELIVFFELDLILYTNTKVMIEKALINNHIEEL